MMIYHFYKLKTPKKKPSFHYSTSNPSSFMAAPNGSYANLDDRPAIAVTPINCVPYSSAPPNHFDSDMAQQNDVNIPLKNQPAMIFLPQTTEKELHDILSVAKNGVAVSGSAAKTVGPLIGSIDISESEECLLFRVALPSVKKDETFKCNIQADGTITIQGVTHTGEKKVHAHGMVFEMHTQNLAPPGDFSLSFQLGGDVDPSTLEHVLANGVLEGVVKKKATQSS